MERFILREDDHVLSPVVVVATFVLLGLFALGIVYQLVLLLV